MSPPEVLLWSQLRGCKLGFKVRRQHAIGPYVADFSVRDASLVIEVDGMSHDFGDHPQRAAVRDRYLEGQGYRVASDVMDDLDAVLTYIASQVTNPLHRPSDGPPPRPGEEL
jgi:very-short-patch-repair endonuclease